MPTVFHTASIFLDLIPLKPCWSDGLQSPTYESASPVHMLVALDSALLNFGGSFGEKDINFRAGLSKCLACVMIAASS